MFISNYDITSY